MYNQETLPDTMKSSNVVDRPQTNWGGGDTHMFTPSLLLDTRIGYSYQPYNYLAINTNGTSAAATGGFNGIPTFGLPVITLAAPWGGAPVGNNALTYDSNFDVASNLTWVKGRHNLDLGFQEIPEIRGILPGTGAYNFTFNNAQTASSGAIGKSGASLASALVGLPASVYYYDGPYRYSYPTVGFYAQDKWKIRNNVTISMGLRYDHFTPPHATQSTFNGIDMTTGTWFIGGGKLPAPCTTALAAPCIPGAGTLASVPYGTNIAVDPNPDIRYSGTKDFGPRLGVAWRPSGKTVVRAGYGLIYDVFSGLSQETQNYIGDWPQSLNVTISENGAGQPLTYMSSLVNPQISQLLPGPSPWNYAGYMSDPHKKDQRSHQWNVEIQRQMTGNFMLSAAYVGSASRDLEMGGLANNAEPSTGSTAQVNASRPYPYFTTIHYDTSRGKSDYEALELRAERRFSQGFEFLIAYTFEKSLDNGTSGWFGAENGLGSSGSALQDYNNPQSSRSVSAYDVPQYWTASGIYELPFGKGKR